MEKSFFALGLIALVFVSGCTQVNTNQANGEIDTPTPASGEGDSQETPPAGGALVAPFYEPFTTARFEQAKSEGKIILLEFYANWCPICAAQKPELESAFSELTDERIVGFQVNYKDSETDASEEDLARQFGVTYQHTHVVIDAQENVLLKEIATQWDKETVVEKLTSAAG